MQIGPRLFVNDGLQSLLLLSCCHYILILFFFLGWNSKGSFPLTSHPVLFWKAVSDQQGETGQTPECYSDLFCLHNCREAVTMLSLLRGKPGS